MSLAYDAIFKELKKLLADKTASNVYDYEVRGTFDIKTDLENHSHFLQPIFIRHPNRNKVALYFNPLAELFVISQDQFVVYECVWTVDDLLVWDNLCSMHAPSDCFG
tara:strand:+ start:177 stop:497 length:321 start_codon:yes stop_codon:yes gene_type:complete